MVEKSFLDQSATEPVYIVSQEEILQHYLDNAAAYINGGAGRAERAADEQVDAIMDILDEVDVELDRAITKHPQAFRSNHEGFAILKEEVDELWGATIKQGADDFDVRAEAVQVAAMAVRFILDMDAR